MDELVIKYYRQLCRDGFPYSGSLENPSIFLDTVGEKIRICSRISHSYIHIFINVRNGTIDEIKYLCNCDPTANVVVEALCSLVKGKTIKEANALTGESFSNLVGSRGEEFLKKANGLIDLLHRGLDRYQVQST